MELAICKLNTASQIIVQSMPKRENNSFNHPFSEVYFIHGGIYGYFIRA